MKKAIPWILYVIFVGVLIYGAVLRTSSLSAGKGPEGLPPQENDRQLFEGRERSFEKEGSPPREGRGYLPLPPQDRFSFRHENKPRWRQGEEPLPRCERWLPPPPADRPLPGRLPLDSRRWEERPHPTLDEELNNYAERYLHLDELLEESQGN